MNGLTSNTRFWLLAIAVTLVGFFNQHASCQDKAPQVGEIPPALAIKASLAPNPSPVPTWDSLKGKPIVLEFWASWCGGCIVGLNKFEELLKDQRDVVVLAVNSEPADDQAKFIKKFPSVHFLVDDEDRTAKAFKVKVIPHCVLIGPDGLIKGITFADKIDAETLNKLRTGQPIDLPTIKGRSANLNWDLEERKLLGLDEPVFQVIIQETNCLSGGHHRLPGGRRFTSDGATIASLLQNGYGFDSVTTETDLPDPIARQKYRVSIWVPPGEENSLNDLIIKASLATSPVVAEVVPKKRKVFVATLSEPDRLKPSTKEGLISFGGNRIDGEGITVSSLLKAIQNFAGRPVLSDSIPDCRLDIQLKYDLTDFEVLRSDLKAKTGIELKSDERTIDILSIRKKAH
jgi:thiol-disulfide isomerase/thioredoxin